MAILKYFSILIITCFLFFSHCSSKLTSAEAQKIIQQHFPSEYYTIEVTGVRKEENYYICKSKLIFKSKVSKGERLYNKNFKLFKYDTGWKVEEYQVITSSNRKYWAPFSDYIERINSTIEYEELLQESLKRTREKQKAKKELEKKEEK